MSIIEIKEVVLKQLEEVDEKLLRMVYVMMEVYFIEDDLIISYDVYGNLRCVSEF